MPHSKSEIVFPAAAIAQNYRVQHKEIIFISLLFLAVVGGLCVFALFGVFSDSDGIYQAMGRQKALADVTAGDWVLAICCGFFFICACGFLVMGLRHAKALRQVIAYLDKMPPDANRGLILTQEGVRVFVGVLHEAEMKHFLRRGVFDVFLPWREIEAWIRRSGARSRSRGMIYFYGVVSKTLDKSLGGTLEIHVKYFAENQAALEREIEVRLGKPVEKGRGLEDMGALVRNLTGEDEPR